MNKSHPTLKFELEHPTKDNSICLLDCSITIGGNGEFTQGYYEKRAKKPLFIHNQSAHPQTMKEACILSLIHI